MSYAVPNPYVSTTHPPVSRFHGGIWTRPVFGFPRTTSVQSVFKCNDFNDGNPGLRGLGADYKVGNGVFGNARNGGGVFGPSLYGLQGGSLGGQSDDIDAIANYILNTATVSPTAFDIQTQFRAWYKDLGPWDRNFSDDVPAKAAAYRRDFIAANVAGGGAAPAAPTATAPSTDFSKATITNLQQMLNTALVKAGYSAISADGALGPGTCGAIQTYRQLTGNAQAGVSFDTACAAKKPWRMPTKASSGGGYTPLSPATTPEEPMQAGMFGGVGTWAMIGGGVLAIGLAVVGKKKGWF